MKISERYSESHEHGEGVCVTSHKRNINNKVYLFTRVGTRKGVVHIGAYRSDMINVKTHSVKLGAL